MTVATHSAHELRLQTVGVIDRLVDRSAALDVGAPPEVLLQLRHKLAEDVYRVLVLGEAKRGKSTFVNALLGAEVLPTDVDVATSQVFYVRPAPREAYRIRFENGSAQEITREDLPRFGSQVVADQGGGAATAEPLLWIEVDVPARFVPERVGLLDTPGLGALYAAHAQVTRRFVPQADAVVLVLDSGQPLGEREISLLESVVEVTPRVFFIQTKIDQHSRDAWEENQRRNEEILRQRFGTRIAEPRVWPISSRNLLTAARSDDPEALLIVSRYRQLADALQRFLDEVCAAPRAAESLALAAAFHSRGRQVLTGRLQSISENSRVEAAAHREAIDKRWKDFQAEWGEHGGRRRAMFQEIRQATSLAKQGFREALQPGGSIARAQESRVDAVDSVETANRLGEELSGAVVAAAMDEWTRTCEVARRRYADILASFLEATNDLAIDTNGNTQAMQPKLGGSRFVPTEDFVYDRLIGSFGHTAPAAAISGILIASITAPFVVIPAAAGVLWAMHRGWDRAGIQQVRAAKQELMRHLRTAVQEVQHHFLSVDSSSGRASRVDEHFNAVEAALTQRVEEAVKRRVSETRKELARLEAHGQLRAEERAATEQQLQEAFADWEDLGRELAGLLQDDRSQAHLGALGREASSDATQAT